jgi:DNA-binding CsgD family transcriptional regulator
MFRVNLHVCLLFCFLGSGYSQELPPVLNFSPKDYQADNQNWSIAQGENKHIYIANNKGLLEYDGEAWTLYLSPNQTILRSVFFHDDKIYSGSYREFGFWEKQTTGELVYNSLSLDIIDSIGTDEQFWTIERLEDWIIFQSLDHIYTYHTDDKSVNKISIEGSISKMFKLESDLYFQIVNKGLFKIEDGNPLLVSNHDFFTTNLITNLYTYKNQILVQTETEGIYTLEEVPQLWPSNSTSLNTFNVYASLQKTDGGIVLGTISQGVIFLTSEGRIINQITQQESLSNNTVLSVFEDKDQNIWLGLDNGIDCVNVNSSIRVFNDDKGVLGTIYTSIVHNNLLYLGSNQGLFYRTVDSPDDDFQLVEGSKGQVWTLKTIDDTLFCGHNNGSFVLMDDDLDQLSDILGTWCFRTVPNRPNLILQGNYSGLSVLEKVSGQWQFRNKIDNFDVSSKFVEFISPNEVLIDHEYKGVYRVSMDNDFTKVTKVHQYQALEKSLYSSLVKFTDQVYYAHQKGIWEFEIEDDNFQKDSLLSQMYSEETYSSGKLAVTDGEIGLWSFNKNSIDFALQGKLNNNYRLSSIPITSDSRGTMAGYENILQLNDDEYLLGLTQGYMVINYEKFLKSKIDQPLNLTSVKYWENGGEPISLNTDQSVELNNKFNNIHFNFSVPHFEKYFSPEYQFRLKGFIEDWTAWGSQNEIQYSNLPFGDYEFQVRARIGKNYQTNSKSFVYTVKRPFVFSNVMLIVYLLFSIVFFFVIHNMYQRFYKKQKLELEDKAKQELELIELESEQELMQVKNEQLKQDIERKNRELAVSTMSLIKKNEFLNSIKDELQKTKPLQLSSKKVIKIIDKNINNSDDWKMFEEAFNNADKDFLKKIKSKHPSLTPNDLRLCAYLRLNLSSKEIAPLFNISTKSVEVKRYRLRKKMELPREIGLTDYILEV